MTCAAAGPVEYQSQVMVLLDRDNKVLCISHIGYNAISP